MAFHLMPAPARLSSQVTAGSMWTTLATAILPAPRETLFSFPTWLFHRCTLPSSPLTPPALPFVGSLASKVPGKRVPAARSARPPTKLPASPLVLISPPPSHYRRLPSSRQLILPARQHLIGSCLLQDCVPSIMPLSGIFNLSGSTALSPAQGSAR